VDKNDIGARYVFSGTQLNFIELTVMGDDFEVQIANIGTGSAWTCRVGDDVLSPKGVVAELPLDA
jgi:hypothetical protein